MSLTINGYFRVNFTKHLLHVYWGKSKKADVNPKLNHESKQSFQQGQPSAPNSAPR